MPIFSLPSENGIGSMGESAFEFIRFLKKSGQKYWQILPICPPAKADSPYLSYSARAGNPYLIDIDWLIGDGWITKQDAINAGVSPASAAKAQAKIANSPFASAKINYEQVKTSRNKLFSVLHKNFFSKVPKDFYDFCEEQSDWLHDYALFMTILRQYNYSELCDWPDELKFRHPKALNEFAKNHSQEIKYHKMLQYFFYQQWRCLQKYAHENDIKIIGDIPFYVALLSADAWVEPKIFNINDDFSVSVFSGCPPNKENNKKSTGQVWDGPVYNWQYLKKHNYKWWINRIKNALNLYDIIRIDHFKGFEKYYNVPAETRDATRGYWEKGPGIDFWYEAAKQLNFSSVSDMPIFAEDLGIYTPELKQLVENCKFEGIKVLHYAFNEIKNAKKYIGEERKSFKNKYLPHNFTKNFVAYIGTHDTNTTLGFLQQAHPDVLKNCQNYYEEKQNEKLLNLMIESIMHSQANICILLVQDLLKLAQDARINTPGTVGINWQWQLTKQQFNQLNPQKLLEMTKNSERF